MQGIAQAFFDGGPFMIVILLIGLGLLALTIIQFAKRRTTDLSPLAWGIFIAMLLTGALGTVMGLIQGFGYLSMVAPDQREAMIAQMVAIAVNTSALALILALPLSIMIGVGSFLAKKAQRRA